MSSEHSYCCCSSSFSEKIMNIHVHCVVSCLVDNVKEEMGIIHSSTYSPTLPSPTNSSSFHVMYCSSLFLLCIEQMNKNRNFLFLSSSLSLFLSHSSIYNVPLTKLYWFLCYFVFYPHSLTHSNILSLSLFNRVWN